MARITAEWLIWHLEQAGFVLMSRIPSPALTQVCHASNNGIDVKHEQVLTSSLHSWKSAVQRGPKMSGQDWRSINRAHWDEKVALHLGPRGYPLADLRAGYGRLGAIEEAELGSVDGQRILHLQCHFGRDTCILAQRGAAIIHCCRPDAYSWLHPGWLGNCENRV